MTFPPIMPGPKGSIEAVAVTLLGWGYSLEDAARIATFKHTEDSMKSVRIILSSATFQIADADARALADLYQRSRASGTLMAIASEGRTTFINPDHVVVIEAHDA